MTQFHGTLTQESSEHSAFAGGRGLFGRAIAFLYGIAAYAVFFITFLYAIGFVDGLIVPKTYGFRGYGWRVGGWGWRGAGLGWRGGVGWRRGGLGWRGGVGCAIIRNRLMFIRLPRRSSPDLTNC